MRKIPFLIFSDTSKISTHAQTYKVSKNLIGFALPSIILSVILSSCVQDTEQATTNTKIFSPLSAKQSGIQFANNLTEDSKVNYFTYPYLYMGGGVAIGDVNNDGLQDIYFTGNMVENKLYLNKGDLKFEDISQQAGVTSDDRWVTGVTMADVNADGWMDIYVSVSGKFTDTKNQLYINQGLDDKGLPVFKEEAEVRGVADEGNTTQGTFFDYDNDGDLDLYLANYPPTGFKTPNYSYAIFIKEKLPEKSDKLYQNDGKGKFKDVTEAAGISNFGLSLNATAGDFNQDGWQDIYVSNDFATPDLFYFNNGDGTFSEHGKTVTQHTAYFGMGTDAGDLNNDGLLDIIQMDMTPADNQRNKANMASMDIPRFWEMVNYGMHYQYMQNAVQLNNGVLENGLPHFSDIARITGMSSTDWSWAGLLADLDNDGWKDVFVTNGTRRDINNKDYFDKIDKMPYSQRKKINQLEKSLNIPSQAVDNYAFKNNGDLTFQSVIKDWGLSFEGFSNGASYADLDNDGDLEMVINNIDAEAIIFKNHTVENGQGNFLRIQLKGSAKNPQGLGTKLTLHLGEQIQYQELTLTRGFQSSVEPIVHFGLGERTKVDKLEVIWQDGKREILEDISANQLLNIYYKNAKNISQKQTASANRLFTNITDKIAINYRHKENNFDDYQYEILLPHRYSMNGPALAVADVNGDGLDDFYVGGAKGHAGVLYLQKNETTFEPISQNVWESDANYEDIGATFFDADKDGDMDLYVVSGGNESKANDPNYQDRLYLNTGKGNFEKTENALPTMRASGSRVRFADYDGDGDMDVFVGGRIVPQSYPNPAKSYILKNELTESGQLKFTDATEAVAPMLTQAGLVTDGAWLDFDGDEDLDLVIVGEWMPITFLQNRDGKLVDKTADYGLEQSTGWWYSILANDLNKDGKPDLIAGNLGLNYKYQASAEASFDVYANDYDKNGKLDIVLGFYEDGVQYPLRGRQCSSEQIPTIKYKYKDYNSFADATLEDVYTAQDLKKSYHLQAKNFASSLLLNQGAARFDLQNLPNEAQLSSVNGIIAEDFNADGYTDLLLAGNLFSSEVETPRNDASYGHVLLGNKDGSYQVLPYAQSGFSLGKDSKHIATLNTQNGRLIIVANNNDVLQFFRWNEF